MRNRVNNAGLLKLVVRVWRERVEVEAQRRGGGEAARDEDGAAGSSGRGEGGDGGGAERRARLRAPSLASSASHQGGVNKRRSERFINDLRTQQRKGRERPVCLEWDVARKTVPSVWGAKPEEEVDQVEILRRKKEANRRPNVEVRRFRIFERCMWAATYYRVVGREAHARRVRQEGREVMRRRLLAWGAAALESWRAARRGREEEREEGAGSGREDESPDRAERPSRTRKAPDRFSPNEGTMDGTMTRKYAKRVPEVQRKWDVLFVEQQRVRLETGAQVGRALQVVMECVATPGGRSDRRGDG